MASSLVMTYTSGLSILVTLCNVSHSNVRYIWQNLILKICHFNICVGSCDKDNIPFMLNYYKIRCEKGLQLGYNHFSPTLLIKSFQHDHLCEILCATIQGYIFYLCVIMQCLRV